MGMPRPRRTLSRDTSPDAEALQLAIDRAEELDLEAPLARALEEA